MQNTINFLNDYNSIIRFSFSIITILLVFAGWLFLRKNAHLFAKRTEMNNAGKEMSSLIDKMLNLAEDYWLVHEAKCKYTRFIYETSIMNLQSRLLQKEKVLNRYGVQLNKETLVKLRQALTLATKSSQEANRLIYAKALQEATLLHNEIDKSILTANLGPTSKSLIKESPTLSGLCFGLAITNTYMYFCLYY